MNDAVVDQALLWFFAVVFGAPLVGWAVGWRTSFERGIGVGCLLIGLLTSGLGVWVAIDRLAQLQGTVAVAGQLVEYVEETTRESDGSSSTTLAPRVRYVAADGRERLTKGLGGSQAGKEPGAAIPVRYRGDAPDQAVVADFQNIWGAVLALAIFGGLPTLFGTFFLLSSFPALAEPRQRLDLAPAERAVRQFWRGKAALVGNLTLLAAFVLMAASPYAVLPTLGAGFALIGLACLAYLVGEFIAPEMVWQRVAVLVIVLAGFALFAFAALMLA